MCYRCEFCRGVVPHRTPRRLHVVYRRTGPLAGTILQEIPICGDCVMEEACKQSASQQLGGVSQRLFGYELQTVLRHARAAKRRDNNYTNRRS